ncbi:unnamed protein product [Sphenostylis stenocarpa]|uniref:AT-hook motif nuclear-localized protein n=1 Tax=Sphenostylis stenocarpa TaxID=92480 RepID=A0AA86VYU7_9FABA|nr:unnamed protein product [Sphenostylis stenocarpa]
MNSEQSVGKKSWLPFNLSHSARRRRARSRGCPPNSAQRLHTPAFNDFCYLLVKLCRAQNVPMSSKKRLARIACKLIALHLKEYYKEEVKYCNFVITFSIRLIGFFKVTHSCLVANVHNKEKGTRCLFYFKTSLLGGGNAQTETGTSFVHHQITVNIGEDVADKVVTFAKRCCQTVCVLSAMGSLSSVVLRIPCTDIVKWEGHIGILSLSGKYTFNPGEDDAHDVHNWLNLSLTHHNGNIFGGSVCGPMIAATPVYLSLASFKLKSTKKMRWDVAESAVEYPMEGGKQSGHSPTSGLFPTTDKLPESDTRKQQKKVCSETTGEPQEEPSSETTD